jgi:hypothetical protein
MEVDVGGSPSLRELLEVVDRIQNIARTSDRRKLLVRAKLDSIHDVATRAILGEHIAQQLNWFEKIACVDPRPCETRSMERVANKLGVRLRVFAAEEPALRWLAVSAQTV